MSLFTFDWSQIAFIVSPFLVPWWAIANVAAVFAIVFWAIVPALYYSNAWSSSYLPISTSSVFDRFGNSYSSTSILTPSGDSLDQAAYAAYSPVFVPVTYAAYWGIAFTLTTATLVHTAIYHGREILGRFSGRNSERKDVHARLMERYKSIPGWWYAALMCLLLSLSMITLGVSPKERRHCDLSLTKTLPPVLGHKDSGMDGLGSGSVRVGVRSAWRIYLRHDRNAGTRHSMHANLPHLTWCLADPNQRSHSTDRWIPATWQSTRQHGTTDLVSSVARRCRV